MSPTSSPLANQHDKPLPQPPSTQRAASRTMQTVQEARAKIAELTAEVEQLRGTRQEDQERIEQLAVEVAHLKAAHEKDEARINDLTNEGVSLRLKYEDLKEQVGSILPPDSMDLMVELNEVSDRNEVFSLQNGELELEVEKLKAEIEKLVEAQGKNWTLFQAAAVELPRSGSEGDDEDKKKNLKSPRDKKLEKDRSCDGGVM